jgi:hypothetical protein
MKSYRPNDKRVISKIIDGEAIIIKLEQGVYYSLNELGSVIWKNIEEKNSSSAIIDYIVSNYSVEISRAKQDVINFLNEMDKEQLIVPNNKSITPTVKARSDKLSYMAPQLEVYRDMEDLLALDPPVPGMNEVTWKE